MNTTDVMDAISRIQTENLRRTAGEMLDYFHRTGRRPATRRVNQREHGMDGWLAVVWCGQAWREPTRRWEASTVRVVWAKVRAEARNASVSGGNVVVCG